MPRTTIDIDATLLRKLKRRQQREGKTLGELVSELLARSLDGDDEIPPFSWTARSMRAKVDLDDTEAVNRILDER